MPAAESRYSNVSGELVDRLLDFSPLIEPQELWHPFNDKRPLTLAVRSLPVRYCLDLEGLPLREALPFVKDLGRALREETTFTAAIGLAQNKFTAEVAATVCRTGHTLPVESGTDAKFLASRPLNFLPVERDITRRLRLLGIYSLGQLANLPLPALQEQFGPAIVPYYRLAKGEAEERLEVKPPERVEKSAVAFDGPIDNLQSLTAAAERLVAGLVFNLREGGRLGRKIQLLMDREDGGTQQQQIVLSRPTADPARVGTAVQEMLAREIFDCAISHIELTISDLSPARGRQLTLFDSTGRPLRGNGLTDSALESLANLIIKYRQSNFFQPQLADRTHPLPERRFILHPLSHDALVA
jgi:nucleotidyltransferase/DNA polymerase involved in DNA repair